MKKDLDWWDQPANTRDMDVENRLMPDSDLFPLRTVGDVRKLFERHLNCRRRNDADSETPTYADEPNLVLLSIVVGAVENSMTIAKSLTSMVGSDAESLAALDQVCQEPSVALNRIQMSLITITCYASWDRLTQKRRIST